MSAPMKKVAVAGATGLIGQPIVAQLLASRRFEVTILTRTASRPPGFPAEVAIRTVDYDSAASLESALAGQDALMSAVAFEAILTQHKLMAAAARAGVRRVIPSEYGNDTANPRLATVPIYRPKIAIRTLLDTLVAAHPGFSHTVIMNASFLAPDKTLDFIVDVRRRRADIKDGGDVRFCAATYENVAQAVAGVLDRLEETANRAVKIVSVTTTQNEIMAMAKELGAVDGWELTYSRTQDLEAEARERWARGERGAHVIDMFINRAFLGDGWGG